jgi:hypothetical protein
MTHLAAQAFRTSSTGTERVRRAISAAELRLAAANTTCPFRTCGDALYYAHGWRKVRTRQTRLRSLRQRAESQHRHITKCLVVAPYRRLTRPNHTSRRPPSPCIIDCLRAFMALNYTWPPRCRNPTRAKIPRTRSIAIKSL